MPEQRFRAKAAEKHMQKHFPNCPQVHRDEIVRNVAERTWKDVTIGRAVGITVTNYIRHKLTDYKVLKRRHRLTREEARIIEAETVMDIWRCWQRPLDEGQFQITLLPIKIGNDVDGNDDA